MLLALAAAGCGGAARQAGPVGHIEAGATLAQGGPEALAFDRAGNLYGVDCQDSWIFRADAGGRLWIVGGTGDQGFTGNGGTAARFSSRMLRSISGQSSATARVAAKAASGRACAGAMLSSSELSGMTDPPVASGIRHTANFSISQQYL
jgi:hypothetical protein